MQISFENLAAISSSTTICLTVISFLISGELVRDSPQLSLSILIGELSRFSTLSILVLSFLFLSYLSMYASKVPPFSFSISIKTWSSDYIVLLNSIMFSCYKSLSTCCSMVSSLSLNICLVSSLCNILSALISLFFMFSTSRTTPKEPIPSKSLIVYSDVNRCFTPFISISAVNIF